MILVLLGTQNNSFHRLLEEIQKCIDNKIIKEKVIVQAGYTKFESKDMKIFDFISKEEINDLINKADLIITHGGVGSIVGCVKKGKKVIAVPRYAKYNEHVNDHQTEIINTFSKQGFIKGLMRVSELPEILKTIKEFKPKVLKSNTNNMINLINNFIENN